MNATAASLSSSLGLGSIGKRFVTAILLLVVSFVAGWVTDIVLGTNLKVFYALVPLLGLAVPNNNAGFGDVQKVLIGIVIAAVIAGVIGFIVGLVRPAEASTITSWAGYNGFLGLNGLWSLALFATIIYSVVLYVLVSVLKPVFSPFAPAKS